MSGNSTSSPFPSKQWLGSMLFLLATFTEPLSAEQPVGAVVIATGAVSAVNAQGQVRILNKGSDVFQGDRITTASKSLGVLEMIDGEKIVIREESELEIEDYQFEGTDNDTSTMELIKGGFRAITGAIGSQNPDAYKVRSDLSVLGIRGTEYLTRLCIKTEAGNPCERDLLELGGERAGVPEGQYLFVTQGRMYMLKVLDDQIVDTVDVGEGQVGFANDEEVKVIPELPGFLSEDPTPSPGGIPEDVTPLTDFPGCRI